MKVASFFQTALLRMESLLSRAGSYTLGGLRILFFFFREWARLCVVRPCLSRKLNLKANKCIFLFFFWNRWIHAYFLPELRTEDNPTLAIGLWSFSTLTERAILILFPRLGSVRPERKSCTRFSSGIATGKEVMPHSYWCRWAITNGWNEKGLRYESVTTYRLALR